MQTTIISATTTMVSPNKAPFEPAAGKNSSALPESAFAAEHRCTLSTPPPFEDSFVVKKPASCNPPSVSNLHRPMMHRPMMSPPPLPKRSRRHYVDPSGAGDACSVDSSSSAPEQPQTPASAKSVLIDLNAGHSILNNPKSVDVPPLKLAMSRSSFSTREPQEQDGSSVGSFPSRLTPILSLHTPDDDDIDAELVSYQPRFRLQMKPHRHRRFVPRNAKFIPIQNDTSDRESVEQGSY